MTDFHTVDSRDEAPDRESRASGARSLHEESLLIDFHTDLPSKLLQADSRDIARRREGGHVDLPRLREGGVDMVVMALFTPSGEKGNPVTRTLRQIDIVRSLVEANPGHLEIVRSAVEIEKARARGRIGLLLSIENGVALGGSLEVLRCYYALGVRAVGLVWNGRNELGDGVGEEQTGSRLTSFGRKVLEEMGRLGMLVDVSHLNAEGFWDVVESVPGPVIASHSNARAICAHRRNLDDDQLRALARRGGVVGVNFNPPFLRDGNGACLEDVVRHIEYMRDLIGIDAIGIGSDFDGIGSVPEGLEDPSKLPVLTEALQHGGFPEAHIRKILGENFLRVIREVLD
jgi:membrane dipeptidase